MKKSSFVVAACVAAALLCGQSRGQEASSKNFLWKQCREDGLGLHLEPGPFQEMVGSEFSLKLDDGKARIALIAQDCSQYWLDGEDLGPTQHFHVWVELEGANDIRPVVGAQETLPTRTWFSVFAGSTNAKGRTARRKSGTSPDPIEGVMLKPFSPNPEGSVLIGANLRYSWKARAIAASPHVVGINHDVYLRGEDGILRFKRIQALFNLVAPPFGGLLNVKGAPGPIIPIASGTYPVRIFALSPVWARVTLGDDLPKKGDD